ncbi:MAG: RHS repeat protein [Gammaproteobacteria bacterium]|nr:RHS repeat protein [Gammaproteobacteria bacterium]
MNAKQRKSFFVVFVMLILTLVLNVPSLYAQDPTPTPEEEEEEYEYADCGIVIDDADESPCFLGIWAGQINYDGLGKDDGPRLSWRIPTDGFVWATWTPDYKSLNGPVEVFVTVPLYRPVNLNDPEQETEPEQGTEQEQQEEEDGEWAENVTYYVKSQEEAELKDVQINLQEYEGGLAPLGTFEFDGTEAYVGLLYAGGAPENQYVPVDAACFGANCPIIGDITPPLIEDVKDGADDGSFYFEAKVTDDGSGVGNVGLVLNGVTYPMTTSGNDIYGVQVPYEPGQDADWMIIAVDNSGNDAEWIPGIGYIVRGIGLGLGISLDAFWQVKTGNWGSQPAPSDWKECSGFCGDPIDTRTGNLFEQMQLVNLPGRPEINFTISYNSQGGRVGIFGESWVHGYNSHVTEMDNPAFQGAFVQYPDGKSLTFSGPDFTPELGVFDILERDGEGFKLTKKDKSVLYFDSYGDLSRMEDANGNGLTFTYSEQTEFVNISKLALIKADGGREITFDYNDVGLVSQMNLPEGKILTFEYNETDDLVKLVNGEGETIVYEYENHSIVKKISPEGHAYYTNTYDDQRRVTKQVAGTEWTHEMEYGENQTVVTNRNGQKFTYFYNDDGLMIANEDESGNRTSFEYNEDKKVMAETNAEGGRYEYDYDDNGNQIEQKDPLGYVVEREFDQIFNKPLYEKNQNGRETRWEYDEKGNLTKIVNAAGNVSTFSYNQYGQLITSTDFNGNTTTFAYTPAGDLASVTDALGNVTTFEYDGLGRMTKRANPLGVEFAYQ